METIPNSILKLAFGLEENDTLTKEHQDIFKEWKSGKGKNYMKISPEDPRLLVYAGYYDKLEANKSSIWNQIVNNF